MIDKGFWLYRLMNVELEQAVERQDEGTTVNNEDGAGSWFGNWFGGEERTTPAPLPIALSVEQCQCPMGYIGSSCQVKVGNSKGAI